MVYEAVVAADCGDADRARRLAPDVAALGRRWPRWAARLWDAFSVELAVVEHDAARIADLVDRWSTTPGTGPCSAAACWSTAR